MEEDYVTISAGKQAKEWGIGRTTLRHRLILLGYSPDSKGKFKVKPLDVDKLQDSSYFKKSGRPKIYN